MAETRKGYRIEESLRDGKSALHEYTVVVTRKRVAVLFGAQEWRHYEPEDFDANFAWTPREAWGRYLASCRESLAGFQQSMVDAAERIEVATDALTKLAEKE